MRFFGDKQALVRGLFVTLSRRTVTSPSCFQASEGSTKYLYFLGRGIDERSCPLILDTMVARSLDELLPIVEAPDNEI